ncbi:MAG: TolC family protein [Spirochaetales bacterium]|nr:TolC family protein [Spirochaetales bacterium]
MRTQFCDQPAAERQLRIRPRNCHWQFRGQVIAAGNYLRLTRRSQFCSDKIAWFVTKREAKRSARLYHQPAAAPRAFPVFGKTHKIAALVCLCVLAAGNAWAQITLDIESAVTRALENNFSLERSRLEVRGAKRKAGRSWNTLLPSLAAGVSASRLTSVTGTLPSAADTWTPGFSFSASFQLVPAIITNIAQAKKDYEAGLLNYEAACQNLEFQVRKLYFWLLLLQANVRLEEQNVISAQNRYEQARVLQRTGQVSNLDELSARLDMQTQKTNARSAQTIYADALDNLKYLLLIPPEEIITLQGSLEEFAGSPRAAYSRQEPLRITALRKSIESLVIQRQTARSHAYAPTLTFAWNALPLYDNHKWTDLDGQASLGLSFQVDNFLPGSPARERIDTLSDTIALWQNLLRETIQGSRNTIRQLERNIAQSFEIIETLGLNVTLAEDTNKMYEEAYRNGTADLQSVYSSRDNLSIAHNKLLSERYNLVSAILELEKEFNIPFGNIRHHE